jgi:hypothetical protein
MWKNCVCPREVWQAFLERSSLISTWHAWGQHSNFNLPGKDPGNRTSCKEYGNETSPDFDGSRRNPVCVGQFDERTGTAGKRATLRSTDNGRKCQCFCPVQHGCFIWRRSGHTRLDRRNASHPKRHRRNTSRYMRYQPAMQPLLQALRQRAGPLVLYRDAPRAQLRKKCPDCARGFHAPTLRVQCDLHRIAVISGVTSCTAASLPTWRKRSLTSSDGPITTTP